MSEGRWIVDYILLVPIGFTIVVVIISEFSKKG